LGDKTKGLLLPLKEWPVRFKPSSYRTESAKWGKIKKVIIEYSACGSDRQHFEARYPGLSGKFTKLLTAINVQREESGQLVRRPKKRRRINP
jgi:hypothetical protein